MAHNQSSQSGDAVIGRLASLVKTAPQRRYTLAPFLIPDRPDKQGDVISSDEIFDAVARIRLSKSLLDEEHLHVEEEVGTPVEIYTLPTDTLFVHPGDVPAECQQLLDQIALLQRQAAEQFPDQVTLLPAGSAMLGVIWAEAPWKKILSGEYTGLSIEGKGSREPVNPE